MRPLSSPSLLLIFNLFNIWVLAQDAYGPPLLPSTSSCGSDIVTTSYVTSIITTIITTITTTITSTAELPHSCYSYSITSTQSDNSYCGSFNASTCGPIPECIIAKNLYLEVPCSNPCCPETPTVTVQQCKSCQTGCKTNILETITITTGCISTSKSKGLSGSVSMTSASQESSTVVSAIGSGYSKPGVESSVTGEGTGRSSLSMSKTVSEYDVKPSVSITSSLSTDVVSGMVYG